MEKFKQYANDLTGKNNVDENEIFFVAGKEKTR